MQFVNVNSKYYQKYNNFLLDELFMKPTQLLKVNLNLENLQNLNFYKSLQKCVKVLVLQNYAKILVLQKYAKILVLQKYAKILVLENYAKIL